MKNYYEFRTRYKNNNHRTNEWILFVCARATDGERGLKYGGVATALQGTCSDVQLHRLSYLRPRRARAGGQRELSACGVDPNPKPTIIITYSGEKKGKETGTGYTFVINCEPVSILPSDSLVRAK